MHRVKVLQTRWDLPQVSSRSRRVQGNQSISPLNPSTAPAILTCAPRGHRCHLHVIKSVKLDRSTIIDLKSSKSTQANGRMDDGWKHGGTDRWMDGRTDGNMDRLMNGWMDGRIVGCAFAPQFSTFPNTFTGVRAPACRSAFHKYSLNGRGRSRPPGQCRYFTANTNKSAEEECGLKLSRDVLVVLLTSERIQRRNIRKPTSCACAPAAHGPRWAL